MNDNSNVQNNNTNTQISTPITFDKIIKNPALLQKLDSLGFKIPTDVQAASVPPALLGKDLIIQAQTGSGKTLAYSLPLMTQLDKIEPHNTYAIIIAPTRELAQQVSEVINQISDKCKAVLVIGGMSIDKQIKELENDRRIVVGTPGRILDLLQQRILRLKTCRYFVLDEADEMFSMGFFEDVRAILSRLPARRQGLFVSATISPRVRMLASNFLTKPEEILVLGKNNDQPKIEHLYCNVAGDMTAKPEALCNIIETQRPRSAIIFCNTKSDTEIVEAVLRRRGFDARRINSDLNQRQRARIMDKIRAQDLQFLVATDIAARGIDIEQIELVINFSLHKETEAYVHRTGRTGRAGRIGKAISLVGPQDFLAFREIKKNLSMELNEMPLPSENEVADARLAHLYELMRQNHIESKNIDLLMAKKLLLEIGGVTEPSEELIEFTSKLCMHSQAHFILNDTASLDDELGQNQKPEQHREREEEPRRSHDSRGRREQNNNRGRR